MGGEEGFRSRAAELDRAENVAENSAGGPTDQMIARVDAAASAFDAVQPHSLADYRWLAGRLARAIDNEWSRDAAAFLVRLAM